MSLKMKCHKKIYVSTWNVSQHGMSIKMERQSKWNVIKIECYLQWNVNQNRMSIKRECHKKLNVTQN